MVLCTLKETGNFLWEILASCIEDEILANLVNPLGGALARLGLTKD